MDDKPKAIDRDDVPLFADAKQACGQLAIDVAGKAVSTSFVGAAAAFRKNQQGNR